MAATPTGLVVTSIAPGTLQVSHAGAVGATGYRYRWRRMDHPIPPALVTQANPGFGLDRVDQRALPVDNQYQRQWTGAGVRMYFLENGMMYDHTEFAGRTFPGATFHAGGVHDQTNGSRHGSAVASCAMGALGGVAKGALMANVRVRTSGLPLPYPHQPFVDGLAWIRANHPGGPAVITYAAPGWFTSDTGYAQVVQAVQECLDAGFHFTHALGYDAGSTVYPVEAPGNVPDVISVSMSGVTDNNHNFSDESADIWAPGEDAWAAEISSTTAMGGFGGTSSSAPYISGALALLLEANPNLSPARGKEVLLTQASRVITGLGTPLKPLLYTRSTTAEWSEGAMGLAATLDGLEPASTYEVSVASVESGAVSAWSTPIAVEAGEPAETGIVLSSRSAIYLGSTLAEEARLGSILVWEREPEPEPGPDIPAIVGTVKGSLPGAGTLSLTLPSGALGYLAIPTADGYGGLTPPSGWVALGAKVEQAHAFVATSPTPGTEWVKSSVGFFSLLIVGYDTPISVTGWVGQAGLISPSIFTNAPGLVVRGLQDQSDSPSIVTFPESAPIGRDQQFVDAGGWGPLCAVAHSIQETPGPTGTATWGLPWPYRPGAWTAQIVVAP